MVVRREQRWCLLDHGVVAHAPPFLVSREIVPMDIRSELFCLGEEVLYQQLVREDVLQEHAFVLFPIPPMHPIVIECLQRLPDPV
jgi:hypothetical protein